MTSTPPATPPPVDQLKRALAGTEALIAAIRPEQWSDPTPCPGWTISDLVAHLVAGNRAFTTILRGEKPPVAPAPSNDTTTTTTSAPIDGLADYRSQAPALLAAFAQPGVLEQMVTVPAGTVPGIVALHLRITELLVHGWDLAHATAQPTTGLPADLAEQELAFTRGALPNLPPGHSPFGPPQPISDTAPAIDRLAAYLGRAANSNPAARDA